MKLSLSFSVLACLAVLTVLVPTAPLLAQTYTVTDLGVLQGGPGSAAYAVNDAGHVVGTSRLPPTGIIIHAYLWVVGSLTDLGTLGGFNSFAYGINNRGQVVGESDVGGGGAFAFLWQDGVMMELSTPNGPAGSAWDINDAGQITGGIAGIAYIWEDGELTELGTLPDFTGSRGFGINAAGEVVGTAVSGFFDPARGFHWADGVMTNLGTLPGYEISGASAINDVGLIVGASDHIIPSEPHAVLWADGEIIDLGTGPGARSIAFEVNNAGVIVGYWGFNDQFAGHFACKWENGELIDLNDVIPADPGWHLAEAQGINESGQIVGFGFNPDGEGRGFLLTPCDFSGGPGDDCDGNGVPDECQLDCNDNGQPDVCDIAQGLSGDCDGDNVPNECDTGPPITQQPEDQEVQEGGIAFFIVEAEGLSLAYQWRKDGVDLVDTDRILGSQGPAMVILDVQPGDAGEYVCLVTNLFDTTCELSDPAVLTVIVTCAPDFDCDGNVGPIDLAQLLASWGPCPDPDDCPADLNADGTVGPADLAQLLASWG